MNQEITPRLALQILDAATHPANSGKLNRADYTNINKALETLAAFVTANTPKEESPPPDNP